jgi:hypothetical protein
MSDSTAWEVKTHGKVSVVYDAITVTVNTMRCGQDVSARVQEGTSTGTGRYNELDDAIESRTGSDRCRCPSGTDGKQFPSLQGLHGGSPGHFLLRVYVSSGSAISFPGHGTVPLSIEEVRQKGFWHLLGNFLE